MTTWWEWRAAPPADFAVVGDPVSHSLSPAIHQAAYRTLALDLEYVAIRVPSGELGECASHLASLGYKGVNVTLPLKGEAAIWAPPSDPRPESANTLDLVDLRSTNTDVTALRTIYSRIVCPGQRVLVLGGGGGARGAIVALLDLECEVIAHNRTRSRLTTWLDRHSLDLELCDAPDPAGCHLVVDATSAGHFGDTPGLVWDHVTPGTHFHALAYGSGAAAFLDRAAAAGGHAEDGLEMLVEQGAAAFEWWLGREAPRHAMREAVGCR